MQVEMLKSKIYKATVTDLRADYEGSITIDTDLMAAVGLEKNEKVLVANFRNGARFETYVIPGPAGTGAMCINGAATKLAQVGDQIIIMSFCLLTREETEGHRPRVIHVDAENRLLKTQNSHTS